MDWMFERIDTDPAISIRYVNTKEQIADMKNMIPTGAFTYKSDSQKPTRRASV